MSTVDQAKSNQNVHHQTNHESSSNDHLNNTPGPSRRNFGKSNNTYSSRTHWDGRADDGTRKDSSTRGDKQNSEFRIFESIKPEGSQSNNNSEESDKEQLFSPELHAVCLLALFHVNFVCAICNEAIIDCICLECGHSFCALCLHQWLTSNRVCPTCYQFVKEDFGSQRTYCVDEFISEIYTSLQELTQEYFGTSGSSEPPCPPNNNATAAEIQSAVRSVKVLKPTNEIHRQQLKQLRRKCVKEKHPMSQRNDFSLLEQQTELLAGPDSVSLSAVVQFFLSSITAYITYEGGDSIENDFILVSAISVLVWYTTFLILMRLLGYDGSFSDLVSYLQFIRFVEDPPNDGGGDSGTGSDGSQADLSTSSDSSHSNPREFMSSMLFVSNNNAQNEPSHLPSFHPDPGLRRRTLQS